MSELFSRAPLHVWLILAFLIFKGIQASRDRELPAAKIFLLPAILAGLGLWELHARFGDQPSMFMAWTGVFALGLGAAWRFAAPGSKGAGEGLVIVRGSWASLTLMLAVFCAKFALAAASAAHPQWLSNLGFSLSFWMLFGALGGVLVGRALRATQVLWSAPTLQS